MGERAVVGALGGIDAALQTSEGFQVAGVGFAERGFFAGGFGDLSGPQLCFDAMETTELPIGVDQGIDEETFECRGGLELLVVVAREGFELGRIFSGNDLSPGVDAGLERVETGDGLTLRRAGAGGFERIAAIRLDLLWGGHI